MSNDDKKTVVSIVYAFLVACLFVCLSLFLMCKQLARPVESKREPLRGRIIDENGQEHWLPPGDWPPPLSEEEFERIKEEMKRRKAGSGKP